MGITKNAHTIAGVKLSIDTLTSSCGNITNNNIVTNTPTLNSIKSNGLNIPRISLPFLVLAGIK